MHLTNRCHLDTTIYQKVVINAPPAKPTLAGASALCNGPVILNANTANTPGLTYSWSSGDTTKTVTISKPAIISVTNTDQNGCSSKAQTTVVDNRPQVSLGPDLTICQNTTVPALDAQNPGDTYAWQYGPVATPTNSSTTQTQAVDTTTPGVYIYKVTVTDPVTTCTVTDDKQFTINVSPLIALTKILDAGSCGAANGEVKLQFNSTVPSAGPYSYSFTGPSSITPGSDQSAGASITTPPNLLAGTYVATVVDQINGCTASQSVGISNNAFTISALVNDNCDPSSVTVSIAGGPPTAPITYDFTNSSTGKDTTTTVPTVKIPSGYDYIIQVKDNAGCIATTNKNVPASNLPVVIITPSICTAPFTLAATTSGAPFLVIGQALPEDIEHSNGYFFYYCHVKWNLQCHNH